MIQLGLNGLSYISQDYQRVVLEEYIQILIENLIILINENVGGKADRKKIEKAKYLKYLKQVSDIFDSTKSESERFKRILCESYKIIGEETHSELYIMKAIGILESINESSKQFNDEYKNSL